MSLTKSSGNLYDFVTHCHSHLRGACSHGCSYCFVQAIDRRFGSKHHSGVLRLEEKELSVKYGHSKTIFVEHTNDLFAKDVPIEWIRKISNHCCEFPDNTYVVQTKNPQRVYECQGYLPCGNVIIGTTIESDIFYPAIMGYAPRPIDRARSMAVLRMTTGLKLFVTVEPIMEFTDALYNWLEFIEPDFVNIGADSKGNNLPEPSANKIQDLIVKLALAGIKVRQKHNLERLMIPNQQEAT